MTLCRHDGFSELQEPAIVQSITVSSGAGGCEGLACLLHLVGFEHPDFSQCIPLTVYSHCSTSKAEVAFIMNGSAHRGGPLTDSAVDLCLAWEAPRCFLNLA